MQIEQFEDVSLAHYSYAILSECQKEIILIDPSRNPQPYYDYAKKHDAKIVAVIETHPHADFVSSHVEIANTTGATIYVSEKVGAFYPHQSFDEGQIIELGKMRLIALNTPGHSPDSICILLEHEGVQKAVFTGDTLFIGDCGRPDLREGAGSIQLSRNELARMMYHSLHEKLALLNDDVIVYPAHGAGTLCGKNLSDAPKSTIGIEKQTNWSLQPMSEQEFMQQLLEDQPFIPAYFPFDVELNRKGAAPFKESVEKVPFSTMVPNLEKEILIIDTRPQDAYKKGHLPHSVNLMKGDKFETWLGSIVKPGEPFYIAAADKSSVDTAIERAAAIGYETSIQHAFIVNTGSLAQPLLDVEEFRKHPDDYTIVDVRNDTEVKKRRIFENSIAIPLGQLRNNIDKIPSGKPIVVHCAGGYRSAAASSLLRAKLPADAVVYDLGDAVKTF